MVEWITATLLDRGRSAGRKSSRQIVLGLGDDSAVLHPAGGTNWVISADFFLEGVHFLGLPHPPESVGFKALARATSDLVAVGAAPRYFLLSIALPYSRTGQWLDRMLHGMRRAAKKYGLEVIGGDTSTFPSTILSVTVIGEMSSRCRPITRAGAKPGDGIYVSGILGQAALGLELIRRGLSGSRKLQGALRQHLYPEIPIELGLWLGRDQVASSMMDISDGLSTDLGRLCEASKVGAAIYMEKIPHPAIPGRAHGLRQIKNIDADSLALHGGDDYELLFTVPPQLERRIMKFPGWRQIRRIGTIQKNRKVLLITREGSTEELKSQGWDPFRK